MSGFAEAVEAEKSRLDVGRVRDVSVAVARGLYTERAHRLFGFCIYCGHPCRGVTCRGHNDLMYLDAGTPLGAR